MLRSIWFWTEKSRTKELPAPACKKYFRAGPLEIPYRWFTLDSSEDRKLFGAILLTLAADRKNVRYNRIESFVLQKRGDIPVDVSELFAHTHFPKLRLLHLTNRVFITGKSYIPNQTSDNVDPPLFLSFIHPSHTPITLVAHAHQAFTPSDRNEDRSPVSLPKLTTLKLAGECKVVSTFFDNLANPETRLV